MSKPDNDARTKAELLEEIARLRNCLSKVQSASMAKADGAEHERTDDALRLTTARIDAALQGSHVVLFCQDRDLRYTWVQNPALGYQESDIIGKRDTDLQERLEDALALESLKRGVLESGVRARQEVSLWRKGERLHFDLLIEPMREKNGGIVGVRCAAVDVSQRKRAELRNELLAETSAQLLSTHSPERLVAQLCQKALGVLDCHAFFNFVVDDPSGRLHLNAYSGIPEEEARKIEWLDFGVAVCGCAARDGCRIVAEDILNTHDPRADLVRAYGIQAYAAHPLKVEGRVLGTLSFGTRTRSHFTDDQLALMQTVTNQVAIAMERQRSRAQLQQINACLEQRVQERTAELQEALAELQHFSYTITHDLRAPLRAMRGYSDLLTPQMGALDDAGKNYIRRIANAANRMDRLITDALDYSLLVNRKFDLAVVDPHELLHEMLASYSHYQPPRALISVEPPIPPIHANPAGLTQCFSNLLDNAIKFVRPGEKPIIRIWAETRGEYVRLHFSDNGIGIPEDCQERIFEMFQRLNTSYEGTGIGLPLVRKAAQRMQGRVGLESEPGKGSCFWLEFRRADKIVCVPEEPGKQNVRQVGGTC